MTFSSPVEAALVEPALRVLVPFNLASPVVCGVEFDQRQCLGEESVLRTGFVGNAWEIEICNTHNT